VAQGLELFICGAFNEYSAPNHIMPHPPDLITFMSNGGQKRLQHHSCSQASTEILNPHLAVENLMSFKNHHTKAQHVGHETKPTS
jgi:hypothetical protein